MSLALYRKYRPGRFDDVIGQEHVTEPLKRALQADRVHHAYLFSGPRGCGKTSSARILARSLNCASGPTPDPCGECASCVDLAPTGPGSIDVIELDAATHGLVDDARDLREKAVYAPAASRYKVYIIDEAHQLGPGAANALLKLVEEPPPHVRFVFATTEPDKIITTIRSRTHHYAFRLVSGPVLLDLLRRVCAEEGIPLEDGVLDLVVRAAEGSVRDALSILGQLLAGAPESGLTYERAARQLGVTDAAAVDSFVEGLVDADTAAMLRVVGTVIDQGLDPRRFVTDVLDHLRDLIVIKVVPGAFEQGLVLGSDARAARLKDQAGQFDQGSLARHADAVSAGLSLLRGATAPRLQLELLAARLATPAHAATPGEPGPTMAARLERIERQLRASGSAAGLQDVAARSEQDGQRDGSGPKRLSDVAPSTNAGVDGHPPRGERSRSGGARSQDASPVRTSPGAAAAPVGGGNEVEPPTIDKVRAIWPAVLEQTKSRSRVAWMLVTAAQPVSVTDGVVIMAHADGGTVARFRTSAHRDVVSTAASQALGQDIVVDLIHDPGAVPPVGGVPASGSSRRPPEGGTSERGDRATSPAPGDRAAHPEQADEVEGSTDVNHLTGIALIERELGAVKISEQDGV